MGLKLNASLACGLTQANQVVGREVVGFAEHVYKVHEALVGELGQPSVHGVGHKIGALAVLGHGVKGQKSRPKRHRLQASCALNYPQHLALGVKAQSIAAFNLGGYGAGAPRRFKASE